ncbi:MAG: polysulfide reductase NrfD [Gammaproteobacteria bacterium]|nr:polysulfide reductase NrfD [Gammaproteobacteria bacterium]MDH5777256.1 polysulfide reductase NrfD [Gammaproteobacteria bacterium]
MKTIRYLEVEGRSMGYYALLGILGLIVAAGGISALYMEHSGHWVTGMTNQIVWGMPHVFAVFLIVAASGALNVASISSVFNKKAYKPLAPLSAILSICLLLGGLTVLVLDLGQPDRLVVAMTIYNFKSIFAWNMILYNGFIAIVAVYIWFMLERKMNVYSKYAGFTAFFWRLILTTGTGSIFGFLVARQAYDAAIMAPMFIIMSFAYGLAIFILVMMAAYNWSGRELGDATVNRMKNLLGVFVAAVLYFMAAYHLTNLYASENHGVEAFILKDGGIYTQLFWYGTILVGGIIPLLLVYVPACAKSRSSIALASILVILGGLATMYVIIIGGQAYPIEMFPGKIVESTFFDGGVKSYTPTLAETLLGVGGFALALIMVAVAVKVLRFLPATMADAAVDPHYKAEEASK